MDTKEASVFEMENKNDILVNDSDQLSTPSLENEQPFDVPATKRLLRKLDYHLVPFLSLLYLLVV
jgi:hypothetical protein